MASLAGGFFQETEIPAAFAGVHHVAGDA